MKKLRYWWWFISALLSKHRKLVVYASIFSILALSLTPKLVPLFTRFRRTPIIGIVGRFRSTDLPLSITQQISRGLTSIDESGSAIPDLAISWNSTEDGRVYAFTIKDTMLWQDGSPVESKDIHYEIENVVTETPDTHTLVFRLKEPFAPFPTVLSKPVFKRDLLGIGDNRISSVKKNGEYIEMLTLSNLNHERVTYRFYRTTQDVITALKLGEVNEIRDITSTADIPSWQEYAMTAQLNKDRYTAIFFNTKDQNLQEKTFRQALAYAIPNKPDGDERALSPIHPQSWAYNPQVKPYATDQEQAKTLLRATFDDQELPSLELTTFLPYLNRAEEIAQVWTQLGIKTEVKVTSSIPSDFQALLIGQQIPPDPDQYYLWHSTQNTNIAHYASPKIDKLLEDARKTIDQNKRVELYRDFQRFLLEDAPAAFLEHITTYTVIRK